mgnify:CR=1 FL=1
MDPRADIWRRLRGGAFTVSVDQAFHRVIGLCADTRRDTGTWLTPAMIDAYSDLHEQGLAHSVESWHEGELAGGVYGVALGSLFFGESMVSLVPDGSKVALVKLAALALEAGIELIDCQVPNPHLESLGTRLMPRAEFLERVRRGVASPPERRIAPAPPGPVPLRP